MTLMGSMPLGSAQAASASTRTAYVGCRTTKERNARGKGIGVYRVTPSGWTQIQLVEGLDNPSFLALDRTGRFLYALHGDLSDISAFSIDAEGRLGRRAHGRSSARAVRERVRSASPGCAAAAVSGVVSGSAVVSRAR